jgi:uncharacterized membrane protein HdeD (DUF308 family)
VVADLFPFEEPTGLVVGIVAVLVGIILFIALESSTIWLRVLAYLITVLMVMFGIVNIIFSFL